MKRRLGLPVENPLVGQPLYPNDKRLPGEFKGHEARVRCDHSSERASHVNEIRALAERLKASVDVEVEGDLVIRLVGTKSSLDKILASMGLG
jgi:hypothetical protein